MVVVKVYIIVLMNVKNGMLDAVDVHRHVDSMHCYVMLSSWMSCGVMPCHVDGLSCHVIPCSC